MNTPRLFRLARTLLATLGLAAIITPAYAGVLETFPPTVSTAAPTDVTATSAVLGGNVADDGGSPVSDRGIVWGLAENPTTEDNTVPIGSGSGTFSATVGSLPAGTTLHVRAYADNGSYVSYGADISFTTPEIEVLSPLVLNRRTGLYEHTVRVFNSSTEPMTGFRLTNVNLLPGVQMWNRTHPYLPILEDWTALPAESSRDVLVSYYSLARDLTEWDPDYNVENLSNPEVTRLPGDMSGLWHGLASRSAVPLVSGFPDVGARLETYVQTHGALSGKITEGKTVRSFTGMISGGIDLRSLIGEFLGGVLRAKVVQADLGSELPYILNSIVNTVAPYAVIPIPATKEEQRDLFMLVVFFPEADLSLGLIGGEEILALLEGGLPDFGDFGDLGDLGDSSVSASDDEIGGGLLNLPFSVFLSWRKVWGLPLNDTRPSTPGPVRLRDPAPYLSTVNFGIAPLPDLGIIGTLPLGRREEPSVPQGYGFGILKPSGKKGDYTMAGRLPDGSTYTCSSFYGSFGQVLLYRPLYENRGSVQGLMLLVAGEEAPLDNSLVGITTWRKPAPLSPVSRDRVYPDGFEGFMIAMGGTYRAPSRGELSLGLPEVPSTQPNLFFTADGEGLDESVEQAMRVTRRSLSPLRPNPAAVKITSFSAKSGLYTGSFKEGRRTASFRGLLVPPPNLGGILPSSRGVMAEVPSLPEFYGFPLGYGYFLLSQEPESPLTRRNTPILSGPALLFPAVSEDN